MDRPRPIVRLIVYVVALLVSACQASAQQPAEGRRIGIALEGGGALGLAHIGVLRWMEEHRIPVYFVGGTSMGGLVGGMYSMGMTPDELEKLVSGIDWNAALGQQIAYKDLAYRRKQDRKTFQNSLEFGLKKGFSLPGGLNTGQEITFLFDRTVLPYSDLKSFDDLPIPFRCVAVELGSGKAHVFQDGPLGEALRATMSLPAIFAPVKEGDNVYADGGLLDNLPVDVVKEMGAGVVIGVHLDAAAETGDEQNMFSVMGRSISVMIAANELRSIEKADLLVAVDLNGFTSSEYDRGADIITRGYEAAARKAPILSGFSVSEDEWRQYIEQRQSRKRLSVPAPVAVQVAGVEGVLKKDLESTLASHAGKPVDVQQLETDIRQIAGVGRYSRFSYRIAGADTQPTLVIGAEERSYAPPFVNIGVIVDGNDYQNVRFTLTGRITALDVHGYRSEWRTDFSAGAVWALNSEFYRPFSESSRWFVAPRVTLTNSPIDLYDRSTRVAAYRLSQYGGGFDVGYEFDRFSEIRLGYELGHLSSSLAIGQPDLPTPSGRTGDTGIRYDLDKLDSPIIPRTGQAVRFRAQWFDAMPGAQRAFPLSELYFVTVQRISKPGSVYVQGYGGSTFGHNDTGLPQFFLGGPTHLGAYGLNELRGNQYFLGRLGYLHEVFRLPPLVGNRVFLTSAYEVGKMYGSATHESKLPMDGAVGALVETFMGPISIGASVGDTGHHTWYFGIGRTF